LQACTWQSFGHRPVDSTPHDFKALHLLEQLATDPGIVAVLKERELVVGTLGEMDPIDDRLMKRKQQHEGVCLLGYNTNGGARIDLKLRTDDLQGFRPYSQLAATLIHELSHNWVGEHNLLFWSNYGQMRIEYVATHTFSTAGWVVHGKTTAQLAGLPSLISTNMDTVFHFVMTELAQEMAQYHLSADLIAASIRERCDELERASAIHSSSGWQLGGGQPSNSNSPRSMALQAAERRRQQQQQQQQANEENEDAKKKPNNNNNNNNH
jgi:WLM domain